MPEKRSDYFPQRRSIRLEGYDYSSEGGYFITIVTRNMEPLFGVISDGVMQLNEFGNIVKEEWFKTQALRPQVELLEEEFVVMPNHIHGILWLFESGNESIDSGAIPDSLVTGTVCRASTTMIRKFNIISEADSDSQHIGQFGHPIPNSIPTIVGAFKSVVTKRINLLRGTPSAPVWHRNYYEHIICSEKEYENIANYIYDNPKNWGLKDDFFLKSIPNLSKRR